MNLKQRILQRLGALMLASILCLNLNAQHAAVKTNLLYDATLTPNLGVELGLGRKSTMQVLYSLNLWKHPLNNDKMWKHWQLLGEYRWWPCSKFNGHFIGPALEPRGIARRGLSVHQLQALPLRRMRHHRGERPQALLRARQTGAQPDVRVLNADATTCTATFGCAAPAQCAPPATTTSTPLLSNSNLCQSNTS